MTVSRRWQVDLNGVATYYRSAAASAICVYRLPRNANVPHFRLARRSATPLAVPVTVATSATCADCLPRNPNVPHFRLARPSAAPYAVPVTVRRDGLDD